MPGAYDSSCFNVRTIDQAKAIILTPEDSTTDKRWATETPYLGRLINDHLKLESHHRLLDYGCGIGRMSKELIEKHDCSVVGLDTSVSMRALAPAYVKSDQFLACGPPGLYLVKDVHFAIAVWTLQHIPQLATAIRLIDARLQSRGKLFVVNNIKRCIPAADGDWVDDGADVREQLGAQFNELAYGQLDEKQTSVHTAQGSFWGVYQRRS